MKCEGDPVTPLPLSAVEAEEAGEAEAGVLPWSTLLGAAEGSKAGEASKAGEDAEAGEDAKAGEDAENDEAGEDGENGEGEENGEAGVLP